MAKNAVYVSFRAPREQIEELNKIAKRVRRGRSHVIREALALYLAQRHIQAQA